MSNCDPQPITLTYFWCVVLNKTSNADNAITSLLELVSALQMVRATKYVVLFRKNKPVFRRAANIAKFGNRTNKKY